MRPRVSAAAVLALAGCAGAGGIPGPSAPRPAPHGAALRAPDDLTVHTARLVPLDLGTARTWGEEPGGGTRAIVAGARLVDWPDGSILAAQDRLPAQTTSVVVVPERMGGGFLFVSGQHLWRSDSWLGAARPLFTSPTAIGSVHVGLDRVYVRSQTGALGALDPRTGVPADLGPLPASPNVGRLAALDAWRAVVEADLRGPLVTLDAGSTWRRLALPIEATEVVALQDSIVIGGADEARQVEWWEVRADGQTGRLGASPFAATDATHAPPAPDPVARVFGARPLASAIEDGWPLTDGTAMVARDGAIARVRLSDGAIVAAIPDAFSLRPARCHPVTLARPADPGAFGFVCGEPRGRTVAYRWSAAEESLVELRRFDQPREVVASGNGALAARGPCAPDAAPDAASPEVAWCIQPAGEAWREIRFRGDDVDRARLVVLEGGKVALVRGPRGGDLSTARLTLTDGVHSSHLPLLMPEMRADVARALLLGVWMDGFEVRRPGVLGGWVDAAGSVLGVEIDLDGHVRVGEYLHDAGAPYVSGRWGLGWTASRRGFETTDGGMTWATDIELPDPIAKPAQVPERACGPVGCLAAGWMRVGWGPSGVEPPPKEPPPRSRPPGRDMQTLDLTCEPTGGPAPEPRPAPAPARRVAPPPVTLALPRPWMTAPPPAAACSPELAFFQGHAAPTMGAEDCALNADVLGFLERPIGNQLVGHLYAWGPRSGDWDLAGKWRVSWLWPWGGWQEVRGSAAAPAPWGTRDATARFLGVGQGASTAWSLVAGDDPDHALLLARHAGGSRGVDVLALETDRAPVDVRRPGGEPFPDVQGATRVAGRWYLATVQPGLELGATVVWALDGAAAREVARLPRLAGETVAPARLARRTDGGAVGVVVDGQATLDRGPGPRWVTSIDLESGAVADPQPLAPLDVSDRAGIACTGDDAGWEVDLPYAGAARVHVGPSWSGQLQSPAVRVRLSPTRSCIERVSGSVERDSQARDKLTHPAGAHLDPRTIDTAVLASQRGDPKVAVRYGLRCSSTR